MVRLRIREKVDFDYHLVDELIRGRGQKKRKMRKRGRTEARKEMEG